MARVHLGLTDHQFYALTPRQLRILMDRHRERTLHAELLTGILAATVANHSFAPPKTPAVPGNFMPSQWDNPKARKPKLNRKFIAQNVRCFLMAQAQVRTEEKPNGPTN